MFMRTCPAPDHGYVLQKPSGNVSTPDSLYIPHSTMNVNQQLNHGMTAQQNMIADLH
jgi:hypothetical protein